ncbi:MAG: low specificity L-threonine aldolase, partial [Planctomycetota bacterium]|nr:low specificity L-threonine aldolase [Planctomycetota bacterium]
HENAKLFANRIREIEGIVVDADGVETNLVFFEVDSRLGTAAQLSARLVEKGVKINSTGAKRLRACTHLDVSRESALRAAEAIAEVVKEGFGSAIPGKSGPYSR